MIETQTINSDWSSPPGDTINEILIERRIQRSDFVESMKMRAKDAELLISGVLTINVRIAQKLSDVLGASSQFWLERENQFNASKKRITEERKDWLNRLPIQDLVKHNWIPKFSSKDERFFDCLKFFGVSNLIEWQDTNQKKLSITSFRTSSTFDSRPESIITWLRMGEIKAKTIKCSLWNEKLLKESLPILRALSREPDHNIMLSSVEKILSICGVILSIVQTPTGCKASGATYFLTPKKAIIILSFRYLSDDHFWFTLFHEIGHLILHGNKGLYLEGLGENISQEEHEANKFAEDILVPFESKQEMYNFRVSDWKKIIRFAKKIGISPGIVVGQLQHANCINYAALNRLKTRYSWKN